MRKFSSTAQTVYKDLANEVSHKGYAFFGKRHYLKGLEAPSFNSLISTYAKLEKDPSPGNRYRAYTRCGWNSEKKSLVMDEKNDYFQSKEYNDADGGLVRKFNKISDCFLSNPIVTAVIQHDIGVAKHVDAIHFDGSLEVGLHQIRYSAKLKDPSYSSPIWLHKDDEPFVFVHLFNLTTNAIGGDNLIAEKPRKIDNVLKLEEPLDSLVVNQKVFHAVTPIGSRDNQPAYRDILLVTFFNKKENPQMPPTLFNNSNLARSSKQ